MPKCYLVGVGDNCGLWLGSIRFNFSNVCQLVSTKDCQRVWIQTTKMCKPGSIKGRRMSKWKLMDCKRQKVTWIQWREQNWNKEIGKVMFQYLWDSVTHISFSFYRKTILEFAWSLDILFGKLNHFAWKIVLILLSSASSIRSGDILWKRVGKVWKLSWQSSCLMFKVWDCYRVEDKDGYLVLGAM